MKISVITAVFNAADTIADTLRSVATQTHPNVEHIVIDGASTDATLARIAEYGAHLAKLVSEPDLGIYDAMSKGLMLATGDVVCFLNADDFYAHTHVLAMVATEMADEKLEALLADVVFVHSSRIDKVVRYYNAQRFQPSRLAFGAMPAHPALFVRRRIFERVGGFKKDYQIAGDFEWVVRAFGGISPVIQHYTFLPQALVTMRLGGASTANFKNRWRINLEMRRACRENGIRTNIFKLMLRYLHKLTELKF